MKFRYAAASNISFKGVVEEDITREEWAEMTWEEQDYVLSEITFNLVEVWADDE